MARTPSAVSTLDNVYDSRFVTLARIAIYRHRIAPAIEGDALRIPQSSMNDFKVRAIWIEPVNCALIIIRESATFLRRDIHGPVAHGSINPAVRAHRESVEIMSC